MHRNKTAHLLLFLLQVWDGAKVLSQLLLLPTFPRFIAEAHPTYSTHLSNDSSGTSKLSGLQGWTVAEIGAGLGLCSVAAAHQGAQVGFHYLFVAVRALLSFLSSLEGWGLWLRWVQGWDSALWLLHIKVLRRGERGSASLVCVLL